MRRSSFEGRLRDELHAARPPREGEAERRAWHVVRAAHAARSPVRERRRGWRVALIAAGAVLVGALALSPAGAKVGDWIGDVVSPAPEATRSTLTSLPAKGRLLVVSADGPRIVQHDGARRRLGDFHDATWSPGGLFVAAARGRELVALEPDGDERWARPGPGRVSAPRWSPDGYRIAYRSGRDLWVAIADNEDAWRLARDVGAAPPAWEPGRPSPGQALAFQAGARIKLMEVERRRVIGTSPPGPQARELWWTADGRRLVAVTEGEIRLHDARARLLRTWSLPPRLRAEGSALDPAGRRLAVAASRTDGRGSELLLYRIDRKAPPGRPFAVEDLIEGLTWSIDGRVLVLGRPFVNQWVFLRARGRGGFDTVSRIRQQFSGAASARDQTSAFPRPAGWCYAEPHTERPFPPCTTGAAPTADGGP